MKVRGALWSRRLCFAALAAAVALVASGCVGGEAANVPSLHVTTTEMKFAPGDLAARADKPFVVVVDNRGEIAHTFSLNELGLEVKVPAGQQRRLAVTAPAAEYDFVCRILDHEGLGMVGQLVVT